MGWLVGPLPALAASMLISQAVELLLVPLVPVAVCHLAPSHSPRQPAVGCLRLHITNSSSSRRISR